MHRCKAYIETVEAKLRVHGEYIAQLETSLSDAQVRVPKPKNPTQCGAAGQVRAAFRFHFACFLA